MKIRKHFFFTEAKRTTSRTYGGSNYTLNVYENKGRGKIARIGEASACTRGHRGEASEAWAQVVFPALSRKIQNELRAFNAERASNPSIESYYSWTLRDTHGIRLDQL